MKRYRLKRDVAVMFNGGGNPRHGYEVTAKAGDPVKMVPDGRGIPCFALVTGRVSQDVAALFAHDSRYYHVWVSADDVEEVS